MESKDNTLKYSSVKWPERIVSRMPRGETCFEALFGRCQALDARLSELAELIESYPYFGTQQRIYMRGVLGLDCGRFDILLKTVRDAYAERIRDVGAEHTVAMVKRLRPQLHFFVKGDVDDVVKLATRIVSFDVGLYALKTDDFVNLRPDDYRVHESLGLARDQRYNMVKVDGSFSLREQGVVYKGENVIFYHPFLRRYFTSSFTEITTLIRDLSLNSGCVLQIAIDPFRMHVGVDVPEICECDYWRGPKYDPARLNDPRFAGDVVYKRLDNPVLDITWPVDRLEARIVQKSPNEKSFTIEEIRPMAPSGCGVTESGGFRLNRFAHFIWDGRIQAFSHLDVAVIAYDADQYAARFKAEFPGKSVASTDKVKLVRVDGHISLDTVTSLISDFFRYDELVGEFFGGK